MKEKLIHYTLLFLILLMAGWLRINTFWMPHTSGDEFHYLALALKLDSCGLDGYNIRGVDYEYFSLDGVNELVELRMSADTGRGVLLEHMYAGGRGYYDNPLYNNSPGLSYLLMWSQKTLGHGKGYFVSASNYGKDALRRHPEDVLHAQFYAVFWPFVFGLVFVLLTYLFARMVFDLETALIAAFLIAANPVSMLVSQKLWGDEISGVFVLMAAIFFFKGYKSRSTVFGVAAGVAAGIAILFKQTAGFFLIGITVFYFWDNRRMLTTATGIKKFLLNPFALAMVAAFLAVSGFWFLKVYEVYGGFIHKHLAGSEVSDSFAVIKRNRPPGVLVYLVGIPFLSPVFLFAWVVLSKKVRSFAGSDRQWIFPFLACWIFAYFFILVVFFTGKEHRYMLPAYPAMALLAAYVLNRIRVWGNRYTRSWKWLGADEFVVISLLLTAQWSIYQASDAIYNAAVIILKPF